MKLPVWNELLLARVEVPFDFCRSLDVDKPIISSADACKGTGQHGL